MGIKKVLGGLGIAAMAAMSGISTVGTPQGNAPEPEQSAARTAKGAGTVTPTKQAPADKPTQNRRGGFEEKMLPPLHRYGADRGCSPKEYGSYLLNTGKHRRKLYGKSPAKNWLR